MGNAAEHQYRLQIGQGHHARHEIGAASVDLSASRLVLRRDAAHGIGNHAINEPQPIVGAGVKIAAAKAEFCQRRVKQIAGKVAGERSARAVRTLEAGGEANNQ